MPISCTNESSSVKASALSTNNRRGFLGSLGGLVGLTASGVSAGTLQTAQARKAKIEEDVSKLWSKPVNGVRARLVATQNDFTLDHPVTLIMLFQNVGEKGVELSGGVNVMPTLAMKGEDPHGKDHDFNAAIWMTRQVQRLEPLWGLRAQLRELYAAPKINPGDIHMTIINIAPVRVHRQERLRRKNQETRDVQRKRARLAVTEPGQYVLEAIWRPEGLATNSKRRGTKVAAPWQGKQIEFPPISVRIFKDERQEEVLSE